MKRILVIEDDEPLRANLLGLLEIENYRPIGAPNGVVGVKLARENIPDLILCDVMMPELDGYGVLNALRQDPVTASIPFIFLTAKASKADLRQGMILGADDYLTKPFTRTELLDAITARLAKQEVLTQSYNTKLKQAEEKLEYMVHYDSLTNLPNRLLLRELFSTRLANSFSPDRPVPVLFLDLDRFSRINDSLGHTFGDMLLKAVAERVLSCLNREDMLARLQGDQFAVILAGSAEKNEAAAVAQNILRVLSQPFTVGNHETFTSASIGIALYPQDGAEIDSLVKNASSAMTYSKKQGGNGYHFYTREMNQSSVNLLDMETNMRYALERDEFQVYYQPQVELKTGKIIGAEALVRWKHPERGIVSPAHFIPLAEENGMIIPLGEQILRNACNHTRKWQQNSAPNFRIAVNLSSRQFNQQNLAQKIRDILAECQINPQYLELELTESSIMSNVDSAISVMKELRAMGIRLSLDDFGTGFSSLSYLKRFPFDSLKIDQSFVRNIEGDSKNIAIVVSIIQMAHSLNLNVIAEGVETQEELSFLVKNNCDQMQGYLFSRPVPFGDFEELLHSGKRLTLQ